LQVELLKTKRQIDEVSAVGNSPQVQLQQASEIKMIADAVYDESQIGIDVRGGNENEEINYELMPELNEGLPYDIMGEEILKCKITFHFDYQVLQLEMNRSKQSQSITVLVFGYCDAGISRGNERHS
jgi:hypothetical protein